MSGAVPARQRVNPSRTVKAPVRRIPWPWRDRAGRFSWFKVAVLVLEIEPALYVAFALATDRLGARPLTEATHQTGLWAIRFLMISLLASPARAIFNWQRLVSIRRQLGLTALFYTVAHVALYSWDQKWKMPTVAVELLTRSYLQIGLVALVGIALLAVTSTDKALRALGSGWKRLHRIAYLAGVLSLLHYFLQSKADVSEATLMAGLFIWMMGWRLMPTGPDREPLPILALGAASALLAALVEYIWYFLATKVDPLKVLRAETDLGYGPHAAGQVFLVCLCMAIATGLFWAYQRERLRLSPWYDIALYVGGSTIVACVLYAFNLTDPWLPEEIPVWQAAAALLVIGACCGLLRSVLPARQRIFDAVCVAAMLLPLFAGLAA